MKSIVLGLVLVLGLAAPPASAQLSSNRGFTLGLNLGGARISVEDEDADRGAAFGLEVGFGLRNVTFFLNATGANIEPHEDSIPSYTLGLVDLGVRYTFMSDAARLRPFVEGGITGATADWQDMDFDEWGNVDMTVTGTGLTLGGGVAYWFSPAFAGALAVRGTNGKFDKIKVDDVSLDLEGDDRFDFKSGRLELRGTYYFKH